MEMELPPGFQPGLPLYESGVTGNMTKAALRLITNELREVKMNGAQGEIRTRFLRLTKALLTHMSFRGVVLVPRERFELSRSAF